MKKILFVILSAVLFCAALFGCVGNDDKVNIIMPNGAPALVFSKMMSQTDSLDGKKVEYGIVMGTDLLVSKINEFDIALMPTNIAANIYNKGEDIKIISVNVHGVLYMVGVEEITDLNQFIGKTVYNIGQGGTPDITLKYILDQNDIEYTEDENDSEGKVLLKYHSEGSEVASLLLSDTIDYAVLGEPLVTNVIKQSQSKERELFMALDIQEEWQKASGLGIYPQVSLVAKSSFIQKNPRFVQSLIAELNQDIESWIIQNTEEARNSITAHGGSLPPLTEESVINSNIRYVSASQAKQDIKQYLQLLFDYNKKSIGEAIPDDGIYYIP